MQQWTIYNAKNKFSECVNAAFHKGVQQITRHGRPVAVLMSVKDYEARESLVARAVRIVVREQKKTEAAKSVLAKPVGPESPLTNGPEKENNLSNMLAGLETIMKKLDIQAIDEK